MTHVAVRPEIARSWRRSECAGLTPASPVQPDFVEVDSSSRLMVAAAPVLADLAELLDDNSFAVIMTDRDCRVVHLWGANRRFRKALNSYGVCVGVGLDESCFGTNALGCAIETGEPVVVHGTEHFLEQFKVLSCYGTPMRHPLTHRIEGVLDITSVEPTMNPLFRPLVERAVREIRSEILNGAREADRRLFLAFEHATRRRSTPVAVLGGDVVMANRACLDLLGATDPAVLRALFPDVHGEAERELDLGPAGRIRVIATPVEGTGEGVLFRLDEADRRRYEAAPGLRAAMAHRLDASPVGRWVHVAGEPGTGRTTAAGVIAGERPVVTLDASAALTGTEREWAARLVGVTARHEGVVVVDDVHLLPESLCVALRRARAWSQARFVLVSGPVAEIPAHVAGLLALCTRRVELAPLRERTAELPALLAAMGAAVRPDRDWTLSPRALTALAAQSWPGNLAELAALVDVLAAQPAAGRIDVVDLPVRYRVGSRAARLGGLERAERAAIIRALQAAEGNKLRAAEQLGISRTTLYRRMRALEVPGQA